MGTFVEPVTADPPDWDRRAVLRQRWTDLAYFHWPYDPEVVQGLLPPGVTVDVHDGHAWVGLIPFVMRDVRLGAVPVPSPLATFVEINVRTYVVDPQGRRAVWFFSLDVPRALIVGVARSVFALPYRWARAGFEHEGERRRYRMRRSPLRDSGIHADISFSVGDRIEDSEVGAFEHFVSARWALLTRRRQQLLHGRVDHPRWPLHEIRSWEIRQNVVEAAGLPTPPGPPHALYSPGVDVEVAWFERAATPAIGAVASWPDGPTP